MSMCLQPRRELSFSSSDDGACVQEGGGGGGVGGGVISIHAKGSKGETRAASRWPLPVARMPAANCQAV